MKSLGLATGLGAVAIPEGLKPKRGRPKGSKNRTVREQIEAKKVAVDIFVKRPVKVVGNEQDKEKWIEYVAANMPNLKARAEDAPSMGAWAWLKNCQADDEIRRDFYRTGLLKLLPLKSVRETATRRVDDGGAIELIGKVLREGGTPVKAVPVPAAKKAEGTY